MVKQTMLTISKHKEKFYAMNRVLMIRCASRIIELLKEVLLHLSSIFVSEGGLLLVEVEGRLLLITPLKQICR